MDKYHYNTTNGKNSQIIGKPAHGLAAVGDEVLNRIVSDSQLGGAPAYEVDLAVLQRSPMICSSLTAVTPLT